MKESQERRRIISRIITASFVLSALASVGLAIVYGLGGQAQAEGALLGLSLGGIAVGLILIAKHLMPPGLFVEKRGPHGSDPGERKLFDRALEEGVQGLERRGFIGKLVGLATFALGTVALFPVRSLGERPGEHLQETKFRNGSPLVTADNLRVRADDLSTGSVLTVFPQGHTHEADSSALLIKLDPVVYDPPPERAGWAPEGLVAYSKVCTHAGCAVGLYQQESQKLYCPCHQSVFDVLDAASPIGGPATRPLPQLPLGIDDEGFLFARGDFSEPIGPGFWKRG